MWSKFVKNFKKMSKLSKIVRVVSKSKKSPPEKKRKRVDAVHPELAYYGGKLKNLVTFSIWPRNVFASPVK